MPNLTPVQLDLTALLKAWPALVLLNTADYVRAKADVQVALAAVAATTGDQVSTETAVFRASPAAGLIVEAHPTKQPGTVEIPAAGIDPLGMLESILTFREGLVESGLKDKRVRYVAILIEDIHVMLSLQSYGSAGFFATRLREVAIQIRSFRRGNGSRPDEATLTYTPRVYIVGMAPDTTVPASLTTTATRFDYPLPSDGEIETLVRASADQAAKRGLKDAFAGRYTRLVESLRGLPTNVVAGMLNQSLVRARTFGPEVIRFVHTEKERVFNQMVGGLATFTPPGPTRKMAGYERYKAFVARTKRAMSAERSLWRFPLGALLIGPPGTGKSQMARYTACEWSVPMITLSLGALQDGSVGSGQGNLKIFLKALDALGYAVVVLDEFIKSTDSTENAKRGGGTSEHAKVLANFMIWMEERPRGAFLLALANVDELRSGLPEGLLERFPYKFTVARPTVPQLAEIWQILLEEASVDVRTLKRLDLEVLAEKTEGLVGRDVRAIVDEALGLASDEDKPLGQSHCERAIDVLLREAEPLGNLRFLPAGLAPNAPLSSGVVHDNQILA